MWRRHDADATLQVTLHVGTEVLVRTIGDSTYPIRNPPPGVSRVRLGGDGTHQRGAQTANEASTTWWLVAAVGHADDTAMKKRILATGLWFFAGWYAGAILAWVVGIEAPMGLLVGLAAGAFVWADPGHLLWNPSAEKSRARLAATAAASAMPPFEVERVS